MPLELRRQIIYWVHDVPNLGHGGMSWTLKHIGDIFWPGLVAEMQKYVQSCDLCIVNTHRPLPCTKSGHIGNLIILDHFPKFILDHFTKVCN